MKTYVFLTKRICHIGGAEQYIYNKSRYLKRKGWRVKIISAWNGPILIDEFQEYRGDIFPALKNIPACYRRGTVKKTVREIAARIGDCGGDMCIIESEAPIRNLWGELVSKELGCKHFAVPLQESFNPTPELKDFYRFKYDRHELAGILPQSIRMMLQDETAEQRDDTRIAAYCTNSIQDCPDRYFEQLDHGVDFTIGSVGRLEKPCVIPILQGIKRFVEAYPERSFQVVLIGGQCDRSKMQEIRTLFQNMPNVKLLLTGDVYPIPKTFVDAIDVFVSTAGAANATYLSGRPTVKVHPGTGEVIGILGLDYYYTSGKTMYDVSRDLTVEDCLRRILIEKQPIAYTLSVNDSYYQRMEREFERQVSIAERKNEPAYYSEEALMKMYFRNTAGANKYYKLISLFGKTLGVKGLDWILTQRKRVKSSGTT